MVYLQGYGWDYAHHLMRNYNDFDRAKRIENWRNRMAKPYDRDKVKIYYPTLSHRQRKQVVIYAKKYILDLINSHLAP